MNYHVDFDIDLKRNPYKGKYIVVEGIDGSGKTTQVEKLKEYFEKKGKQVVIVKEPTREGEIGELIDSILQGKIKVPSVALQYLYSADRAVNHYKNIIPSLEKGSIIISDRCFWSSIPYGILDRGGVDYSNTAQVILVAHGILSMYHQFIVPDYTFYLKISVEEATKRLHGMEKTHEIYEKREKLAKIAEGYKWLVKQFPKEFVVVDGGQPVTKVTEEIISKLPR
ncbi:MAG: dTMP kinase [Candidatus Levybacteria bacterium]|nr:dTMP kinase [Candidatus Levybacteria bacterium]